MKFFKWLLGKNTKKKRSIPKIDISVEWKPPYYGKWKYRYFRTESEAKMFAAQKRKQGFIVEIHYQS